MPVEEVTAQDPWGDVAPWPEPWNTRKSSFWAVVWLELLAGERLSYRTFLLQI